jgi:hypothetical protein
LAKQEELSKVYLDWIESLGVIKICQNLVMMSVIENFDKNFDLSWTQKHRNFFTNELTRQEL